MPKKFQFRFRIPLSASFTIEIEIYKNDNINKNMFKKSDDQTNIDKYYRISYYIKTNLPIIII